MPQATLQRIEGTTDQAETIAINILIGCFTVLVLLLGLIFGAAIVFVVQAFGLLRILIGLADSWLVQFQTRTATSSSSSKARSTSLPSC